MHIYACRFKKCLPDMNMFNEKVIIIVNVENCIATKHNKLNLYNEKGVSFSKIQTAPPHAICY